MNKFNLLFVIISSSLCSIGQTDNGIILNTISSNDTTSGTCHMTNLETGGSIVGTNIHSNPTGFHIALTKIDLSGNISTLNNIVIPDSLGSSAKIKGLSCSANGDYTCLLSNYISNFLIKFSSSNSIIWQKKIESIDVSTEYYNNTFIETNTGEYYVTISDFHFLGIVKIDSNGNLLWAKKIIGPSEEYGGDKNPGFCSAITSIGGVISTLKDEIYQCIVNLDANGNLVWSKSLGQFGTYRWPRSIKKDNNGNFLIMGMYSDFGSAAYTYLQKIDENGNIIYAKFSDPGYTDFTITPYNEIVLLNPSSPNVITKLDSNLDLIWSKKINSTIYEATSWRAKQFTDQPNGNISFISKMNNHSPVVFNFPYVEEICHTQDVPTSVLLDDTYFLSPDNVDTTSNISNLSVTIANSDFSTTTTNYYSKQYFCPYVNSIIEPIENLIFYIYPNPASTELNIYLSDLSLKDAAVFVYDILGKLVFEKKLDDHPIKTNTFIPGIYNVIIRNSEKVIGSQRVIIQK